MKKTIFSLIAAVTVLGAASAAWAQSPQNDNIYYENLPSWAQEAFTPPDSTDSAGGDGSS